MLWFRTPKGCGGVWQHWHGTKHGDSLIHVRAAKLLYCMRFYEDYSPALSTAAVIRPLISLDPNVSSCHRTHFPMLGSRKEGARFPTAAPRGVKKAQVLYKKSKDSKHPAPRPCAASS